MGFGRACARRWCVLTAVALGLWLACAAVQAGVRLELRSPPRTVSPGDLAVHVFALANDGLAPVALTLTVETPDGWTASGLPSALALAPGEADVVFVSVLVPRAAAAGEHRVRLSSVWEEGEAASEAIVRVRAVASVAILPPRPGETSPGRPITYEFEIVNRGNLLDRFTVTVTSAGGWPTRVEPEEAFLQAGERGAFRVTMSVSPEARPGRDLLTIAVRSAEGAEARSSLFTTILPPGPEEVVGTLLAELDMRLGSRLAYNPLSDRHHSLLTLSGGGEVLSGGVDLALRLGGPWDPTPYRVRHFRFAYDQGWVWGEVGAGSLDLSPLLLSLGATGIVTGVATERVRAASLAGWLREEARFGLLAELQRGWGEAGIAYRETRGAHDSRAVTLWANWRLTQGFSVRAETGFAVSPMGMDGGVHVSLTARTGGESVLRAIAHAVSPWFPGPQADGAGMSLEWSVPLAPFGVRFAARLERDNVLGMDLVPSSLRSTVTAAVDWTPATVPLALYASTNLRQHHGPAPAVVDRGTQILDLVLSAGRAPLVARLSGRWGRDEDRVALVKEWSHEYGQRLSLTLGEVTATMTFSQSAAYQEEGELLASRDQWSLDLRFPKSIALDLRNARDGGGAGIEVPFSVGPSLSGLGRVDVGWDAQGEARSLLFTMSFEYAFTMAPPFLPVRGWLEGAVFVDEKEGRPSGSGEPGIAGAVLRVDGRRVSSGVDGAFKFPPLSPGTYSLDVESLPRGFRPQAELPIEVEVKLGGRTRVHIACERVAEISGVVYDDLNRDGARDGGEPGMSGILLVLEQEGEEIGALRTDPRGRFSFPELTAGDYEVWLDERSLSERYELTTPGRVPVSLEAGMAREVSFGVWQRPRPVVVVGAPPVADFSWDPDVPRVGRPVTFDAGAALGEIDSFAWDFTGDGAFDKEGVVASWTFPDEGFYLVALVVTDTAGREDRVELLVPVGP